MITITYFLATFAILDTNIAITCYLKLVALNSWFGVFEVSFIQNNKKKILFLHLFLLLIILKSL